MSLRDGDVVEKSPGEIVTVADLEAEALLTAGLAAIDPGAPVVGEEGCHSDPGLTAAAQLRGAVLTRFLDPATAATIDRNRRRFGELNNGRMCSGVEYPSLIDGDEDFV